MVWLRIAFLSALARKGGLLIMVVSTAISVAILLGVFKIRDAKYLAAMKLPNRDAFIQDTRPDVKAERCMSNCKPVNSKL